MGLCVSFPLMKSLEQVLGDLFETSDSPLATPLRLSRLWSHWKEVTSHRSFEGTLPVDYRKGVLFVWVPHASQMQDLVFSQERLREQVNIFFKDKWVQSVRFTLDRKNVNPPPRSPFS